jgi:hypothetical protein
MGGERTSRVLAGRIMGGGGQLVITNYGLRIMRAERISRLPAGRIVEVELISRVPAVLIWKGH